jgi:RimJ/RimL family protein N-acetyltransferase
MTDAVTRAHVNLVDSSRQLFRLDPGVVLEVDDGWLFGAGRSSHPAIANAAFRREDGVASDEFLDRARSFFGELGRGFSVWVRDGVPDDGDLAAAVEGAGLSEVHRMPEMVLARRADDPVLPRGAVLERVRSRSDAAEYWEVAAASYSRLGWPPDVFEFYEDHRGLSADNVVAFLCRLDGTPAAISMTIVTDGVAGIYWVGSTEAARGRGLGRAVTAAATNAGFDLGADLASLQASVMGEPIYRSMGYETIYEYRLLMSARP